jgi:hypothetical protein
MIDWLPAHATPPRFRWIGYSPLHMNPCDVGYDIVTLFRRYRLEGHADVSGSAASLDQPLPDEQLNRLHNLFDATVLPSGGEGFSCPSSRPWLPVCR